MAKKGENYPTCNACDGKLRPRFRKVVDPITRESFMILSCVRCGLGHTFPQPQDLTKYYGNLYYGRRHGISSRYFIKRSLRSISRATQKTGGRRLLDVGCGDGSFLLGAKEAGWEVVGTELNPGPAREAGIDVRSDIKEINDAEQFDCITMWHSLEHMRDIKSTLARLSALLHKNGQLLIAVPDNGSWQAHLFGPKWLHLDVPRHLYHLDAASLKLCLGNSGFNVEGCHRTEFEQDLIGWSQSTLNSVFATPNVFLDFLMGKGKHRSSGKILLHMLLGLVLTVMCTPFVSWGISLSKSATLVLSAVKKLPER